MAGGAGDDRYVVDGFDVDEDVLDWSALTDAGQAVTYTTVGGDAVINFTDGSSIRLLDVSLSDFLAA